MAEIISSVTPWSDISMKSYQWLDECLQKQPSTEKEFQSAWHDASESIRKIKYPMLADPTGVLSRAFGVMIEEDGMAYRGTFVVNPEGKIKIAEIHDNNIGRNADELLRKVEAAQFVAEHPNEVCPAKWKKGEATLKPSIDLVGKI